jgi:ABC-2 type transport system permease protein
MPKALQWLTLIVPARWLIPSLQSVFLAGDLWPLFFHGIAVLTLFGGGLLALTVHTMKKRVA